MLVLTKKAKIITAAVAFAAIAAAGYALEYFHKDAFIVETVAKEDAFSYVEETGAEESSGLININTADAETLAELHGVGEALAARIVDVRQNSEGFDTIEDIMKVPGISEKKFEDIKDSICVE